MSFSDRCASTSKNEWSALGGSHAVIQERRLETRIGSDATGISGGDAGAFLSSAALKGRSLRSGRCPLISTIILTNRRRSITGGSVNGN
jgi:hypothetical protein